MLITLYKNSEWGSCVARVNPVSQGAHTCINPTHLTSVSGHVTVHSEWGSCVAWVNPVSQGAHTCINPTHLTSVSGHVTVHSEWGSCVSWVNPVSQGAHTCSMLTHASIQHILPPSVVMSQYTVNGVPVLPGLTQYLPSPVSCPLRLMFRHERPG